MAEDYDRFVSNASDFKVVKFTKMKQEKASEKSNDRRVKRTEAASKIAYKGGKRSGK